jgi:hypothetical protein
MSDDQKRMSVNETILRYADTKSPEEISQMLGGLITPARVASQTKELLTSRNWLDQIDQERLVFHKLRALLTNLEGQYTSLDNAKVQLSLIKVIFDRADKIMARNDVHVDTYNQNVGRIMGRVVDIALSYMRGALREEVDAARWDELMVEAMQHARTEIAQHEIEE